MHDQSGCCMIHDSIFSLCSQASVDHLSVGLKSAPQAALARQLVLRQLRATLCKGQMVFRRHRSLLLAFLLIADASLCDLQVSGPDRGRCAVS